ncbi:MAG TPA: RHS repeat domain-containing protein [Polyangiaceae bacterium]|nr:RHS repeat domain-containing protein [Polyangiaceae bacterium]
MALAALGTVVMNDAGACVITTGAPAMPSLDARGAEVTRRWRSYDAEQRILRDVSVDAEGKPLELDAAANTSSYAWLNEAGRPLISAREAGAGTLQRSDYDRDTHGNAVSFRQTLTTLRGVSASPPEPPSAAYDFVNHYDASSGLLRKHNRTDGSASISYTHDSSGRCESIIDELSVELRQYDADGRLSSQRLDPLDPLAPETAGGPTSTLTSYRYDAEGRLLSIQREAGAQGASAGTVEVVTRWTHADDGSVIVEYIDYGSDAPNDSVERDGQLVSALHRWESWSPGCGAVQASVPVPANRACITE